MKVLIALRSEILKTKRTAAFYVTILCAAFGPLMSMLDIMLDEGISAEEGKHIFNRMFIDKFQMTGILMFPMFLILMCTQLAQIEYKNNAWKQVLASPQAKRNIFMAKFMNIQLLVLIFLVTNQLFMFIGTIILHFTRPALHVLNQPLDISALLTVLANIYVALLAISAIQFWLGLRFKNFIVPVSIGIACWFVGSILVMQSKSPIAPYFPYSYHMYGSMPALKSHLTPVHWTSVGYTVAFLVFGFVDFAKREKVK
jgi:lantibiotic transport system permease protein